MIGKKLNLSINVMKGEPLGSRSEVEWNCVHTSGWVRTRAVKKNWMNDVRTD